MRRWLRISGMPSTIGEPWWTVGEIVAEGLQPFGYEVKVEDDPASHNNIPWVMDGRADSGVTTTSRLIELIHDVEEGRRKQGFDLLRVLQPAREQALAVRTHATV